jgi:hypothetical protein
MDSQNLEKFAQVVMNTMSAGRQQRQHNQQTGTQISRPAATFFTVDITAARFPSA